MLAILSFLGTPIGRVVGIIGLVLFLLSSGWMALKIRDSNVRREALEKFNKQQLEIVVKQQQEFERQTRMLQESQARIIEGLSKRIEEADKRTAEVEAYLNNPETRKSDRPASEILKETFRRLGAPN